MKRLAVGVLLALSCATGVGVDASAASRRTDASPVEDRVDLTRMREPLCGLPDTGSLRASAKATPHGYWDYQGWIASPPAQQSVDRVWKLTEGHPGFIGLAVDHVGQELTVIIDPEREDAVGDIINSLNDQDLQLSVAVRSICNPRLELEQVKSAITGADEYRSATYSIWLDPGSGSVHVLTDSERMVEEIARQYGRLVDVEYAPRSSRLGGGRLGDSIPHFGDAHIGSGGHECSSNMSFVHPYLYRVTVTAGHCGSGTWYSWTSLVGSTSSLSHPDPDLQTIWALYHDYTNTIYTDPCCPSTRSIIGKANPGPGAFVCVGGSITLSQCGIEILNTNVSFCDSSGCTNGLTQTYRSGTSAYMDGGDSGGVVYQRSGSSNALGVGLIVGHVWGYGGQIGYFHTVNQIEAHFGITLLTSP